jgi:hypothetical protein
MRVFVDNSKCGLGVTLIKVKLYRHLFAVTAGGRKFENITRLVKRRNEESIPAKYKNERLFEFPLNEALEMTAGQIELVKKYMGP